MVLYVLEKYIIKSLFFLTKMIIKEIIITIFSFIICFKITDKILYLNNEKNVM